MTMIGRGKPIIHPNNAYLILPGRLILFFKLRLRIFIERLFLKSMGLREIRFVMLQSALAVDLCVCLVHSIDPDNRVRNELRGCEFVS